jgi:hypothetical protein
VQTLGFGRRRASSPHRPREDGLAHPADTSRPNLAAVLGLLSRGGLPTSQWTRRELTQYLSGMPAAPPVNTRRRSRRSPQRLPRTSPPSPSPPPPPPSPPRRSTPRTPSSRACGASRASSAPTTRAAPKVRRVRQRETESGPGLCSNGWWKGPCLQTTPDAMWPGDVITV